MQHIRDEIEFPAHAGMNREMGGNGLERKRVPRTRGDEPTYSLNPVLQLLSSPHTRG